MLNGMVDAKSRADTAIHLQLNGRKRVKGHLFYMETSIDQNRI